MIIKVLSHRNPTYKRLLNYMMGNHGRLLDKDGRTFVLTQNLLGRNIDGWVNELQANEKSRKVKRKNNIRCTHEVLAWSPKDSPSLNLEAIAEMTAEYMRLRNPNAIYVAVPHMDKHLHVHILVASVEYKTGRSTRISKKQLRDLKVSIEAFQEKNYPALKNSVVDHEKPLKDRNAKTKPTNELASMIESSITSGRDMSQIEMELVDKGIRFYSRRGRLIGVVFKGKKHRFSTLGINPDSFVDANRRQKQILELRTKNSSNKEKIRGKFL